MTEREPTTGIEFEIMLPNGSALCGFGLRTKRIAFMDLQIYVAGWYTHPSHIAQILSNFEGKSGSDLSNNQQFFDAIIEGNFEKTFRIVCARDLTAPQIRTAFGQTLSARNVDPETIDQLGQQMSDIPKGSAIVFTLKPSGEFVMTYNGTPMPTIESHSLIRAIPAIYMDSNPLCPVLKKGMVSRVDLVAAMPEAQSKPENSSEADTEPSSAVAEGEGLEEGGDDGSDGAERGVDITPDMTLPRPRIASDDNYAGCPPVSGYLYKYHPSRSGLVMSTWTPRFVDVQDRVLHYFYTDRDQQPRASFPLDRCKVIEEGIESVKTSAYKAPEKVFAFRIEDPANHRVIRLSSPDIEGGRRWLQTILRSSANLTPAKEKSSSASTRSPRAKSGTPSAGGASSTPQSGNGNGSGESKSSGQSSASLTPSNEPTQKNPAPGTVAPPHPSGASQGTSAVLSTVTSAVSQAARGLEGVCGAGTAGSDQSVGRINGIPTPLLVLNLLLLFLSVLHMYEASSLRDEVQELKAILAARAHAE